MRAFSIISRVLLVLGISGVLYARCQQMKVSRELRAIDRRDNAEMLLEKYFHAKERREEGGKCAQKGLEAAQTVRGRWVCVKSTFTRTGEEDY